MQIPLTTFAVNKESKEGEFQALEQAIIQVKSDYDIQGIVHGAISSRFQNELFRRICSDSQLVMFTPLWNAVPLQYMYGLLSEKFDIKIVSVSAMGLGKDRLGKKHGFDLAFEGGDAETLVVNCPLFTKKLDIKKAVVHWDGQRGIFEILEVTLIPK
jgi:uncharacterized protein (TIGR00290 family)